MSSKLSDLVRDFLNTGLYVRGWSQRTVRTYQQGLSALEREGVGITGVPTKPQLNQLVTSMRQRGLQPGGVNMYIRTINSFLAWLHEEGHLAEPLKVRLLPNPPKPLQIFNDTEVRRILTHPAHGAPARTKAIMTLLLDTGLRIDEALSIELKNINWDSLVLTVRGKGNRERVIPFSPQCRKVLWKLREQSKAQTSGLLFHTRSGLKVSYRNTFRDIKVVCAAAGVNGQHVHPHAFRHYFAVTYLRNGGDLYRLSRILGHTNVTTTQIYLRSINVDQLRESHSQCSPLARLA